jgi:hypothetical protein
VRSEQIRDEPDQVWGMLTDQIPDEFSEHFVNLNWMIGHTQTFYVLDWCDTAILKVN